MQIRFSLRRSDRTGKLSAAPAGCRLSLGIAHRTISPFCSPAVARNRILHAPPPSPRPFPFLFPGCGGWRKWLREDFGEAQPVCQVLLRDSWWRERRVFDILDLHKDKVYSVLQYFVEYDDHFMKSFMELQAEDRLGVNGR